MGPGVAAPLTLPQGQQPWDQSLKYCVSITKRGEEYPSMCQLKKKKTTLTIEQLVPKQPLFQYRELLEMSLMPMWIGM